jgi:hypothetical protein
VVGGQIEGGVQEFGRSGFQRQTMRADRRDTTRMERWRFESATHRSLVGALVVPVEFRALGTRVRDLAPVVVGRRRWGLRHCRLDGRVYTGQQWVLKGVKTTVN